MNNRRLGLALSFAGAVALLSGASLSGDDGDRQDDAKDGKSLTEAGRTRPQPLQFTINRWFNAMGSIFLNIDSDNDNADDQSLKIVKNTDTDTGGEVLVRVNENGFVGVGTDAPLYRLHVEGSAGDAAAYANTVNGVGLRAKSDNFHGLLGESFSQSGGAGVFGWARGSNSNGYGVLAVSENGAGAAMYATNSSTTGTAGAIIGVAQSDSADATAIYGRFAAANPGPSSVAVRGEHTGTGVSGIGVWGSQAGGGYGVFGQAGSGRAVYGQAVNGVGVFGSSSLGIGVQGEGDNIGVLASNGRNGGTAMYAVHRGTGGPGWAVYGVSEAGGGRGVEGVVAPTTGSGVGVWGQCNSASGFDFYAGGAGTNYGAASSRRWKSEISAIDQPLDLLERLRGVYFTWDKEHGGHHDIGCIAEEVGEVLPEIVQYEENGMDALGMDYSKMTPLLVEAVNALRAEKDAEIESLRAANSKLESIVSRVSDENEALRMRLARLEALVEELSSAPN